MPPRFRRPHGDFPGWKSLSAPRPVRHGDELLLAWTEPGDGGGVRAARVNVAGLHGGPGRFVEPPEPVRPATVIAGTAAPAVVAKTLDGRDVELASLRGSVVLVNVWATWCEPCRQELRDLATLQERHERQGLRIVAISVDREKSTDDVASFVKQRKLPFAVWHDAVDRVSTSLDIKALPASFLVGRDGRIVWRRDGALQADDPELAAALRSTLGEEQAQPARR